MSETTLGQLIRKARVDAGVPQKMVALYVGISPSDLCHLELGKKPLTAEMAARIEEAIPKVQALLDGGDEGLRREIDEVVGKALRAASNRRPRTTPAKPRRSRSKMGRLMQRLEALKSGKFRTQNSAAPNRLQAYTNKLDSCK